MIQINREKELALFGGILIIVSILGFLLVIPKYDAMVSSINFNIEQSRYSKLVTENYASTYIILNQINGSKEAKDTALEKVLVNLKFTIQSTDLDYRKEPLKSKLESINNIDELNNIYIKTSAKLADNYNEIFLQRNILYFIFVVLNTIGLLLGSIAALISKN